MKFAKSLPTNFVNFFNLVPYPGAEVYDWAIKKAKFLVPKKTFLREISYRDNVPIFETKEFTKEQRIELVKKGLILYERRILQFRLGKLLGFLIFSLTRIEILAKVARWFVYDNKRGMRIYQFLTIHSKNKGNN